MKTYILICTLFILSSCVTTPDEPEMFNVEYVGALKNIMHDNDISAYIDLDDFENTEHFYGLGAVENLKGEILILDGKPFIASVQDNELTIENSFDYKATLFVYATVQKWKTHIIPTDITTYEALEVFIEETAKEHNIDINKPFPFLVEGLTKSADWHVIDWKDGDTEHSHEKHINSGLHNTITNKGTQILGFYSNSHHTIFTHHSTNMHLHLKTDDNSIVGHVDALQLGENMILKLPDLD